jgi:hypothetical protein
MDRDHLDRIVVLARDLVRELESLSPGDAAVVDGDAEELVRSLGYVIARLALRSPYAPDALAAESDLFQ